jgi:ABC-type uncharacterized transport system involved in gliding motility auxiliary subunit
MTQRILGILSYIGMALVFGAVVIRFGGGTRLGLGPEWDQYATYAVWAGLALVLLYTIGQWRDIAAFFQRRNARYGAITGLGVLVVLGILIAVNYVAAQQNKRWDLTENQQYSLSDQTVKLLQGLENPVKVTVFDLEENLDRFRARLTEYSYHSDRVQVEYIDPEKRPIVAKQYELQSVPTIVVEYMDRRERLTSDNEQDLTNALIKVLNPVERKVYFLAGHGEKDPENSEREGYSGIADALRRDNYQFEKLVLAQRNEIPEDATILAIAGPGTDLLESEVPLINQWLTSRAGKLLVLLDPPENLSQTTPMPRLMGLLKEWGIEATETVVVDVTGLTQNPTLAVAAPPYPNHVITDRFDLLTLYNLARAIRPFTAPQNRSGTAFVETTERSWAEANLASLTDPEGLSPDTGKGDLAGPVPLAVAVAVPPATPEKKEEPASDTTPASPPETRVAAFGDSDFAANAFLGAQGNSDMFMNTINWLSQNESLISIRPRQAADRRVSVPADTMRWLQWISLLVIPAAVLGAGVWGWWRRR